MVVDGHWATCSCDAMQLDMMDAEVDKFQCTIDVTRNKKMTTNENSRNNYVNKNDKEKKSNQNKNVDNQKNRDDKAMGRRRKSLKDDTRVVDYSENKMQVQMNQVRGSALTSHRHYRALASVCDEVAFATAAAEAEAASERRIDEVLDQAPATGQFVFLSFTL